MGGLTPDAAPPDLRARRAASSLLPLAGLVAAGGAIGTTARALLEAAFPPAPGGWPWTTFWINIAGSLALGMLLGSLQRSGADSGWRRAVRVGCGTGVIGGFTTYSTFVIEVEQLAAAGRFGPAAAYAVLSAVLGVAAACAGIAMAAGWHHRADGRDGGDS